MLLVPSPNLCTAELKHQHLVMHQYNFKNRIMENLERLTG